MKKILAISLALIIILLSCLSVSAENSIGNVYEIDNVTIIFNSDSNFSIDEQKNIANYIVNPEYGVSTAGLMCTLFGHKNTSETVTTITHKAKTASPRCLEETFAVTKCSRCDETSIVRTGMKYITCCPEE